MSKYATKEQLISIVQDMASKISVPTIGIGGGYAPIGTVISYMGVTAPQDYLACDGSTYNISAYPDLADFFESQFGSKNYFGGDGVTTFGVPTLTGAPTNAIYCIKAVATGGNVYSTDEQVVGTWNGNTLFRKLVETGALPHSGSVDIATGLSNITIHNLYGCVSSYERAFNIQKSASSVVTDGIELYYNYITNAVRITVGSDRSVYSGYIVLEYTKNSSN